MPSVSSLLVLVLPGVVGYCLLKPATMPLLLVTVTSNQLSFSSLATFELFVFFKLHLAAARVGNPF